MFNIFTKRPEYPETVVANGDQIKRRVSDARYFAEELLKAHVGTAGLNKIAKECVRNAMMLAHALSMAVENYERELRAEAARQAMAETAFTPSPELEEVYDD